MAAKSILNEFFQRIRTAAPVYKTQAAAQEADGFVCSLTLPAVECADAEPSWALQAERCFTGTGASKKEAEHAAANAAVAFMTQEGLLLTQQPLPTLSSSGCSSRSTSITPVGSKRSKDAEEDEPENLEHRILDALSSIHPKSLTGAQLAKMCGHFKLKSKVNHLLYVRLRGQNLVEMVGTTPPPAWRATQAALDQLAERPDSSSAQGPLLGCEGVPATLLMAPEAAGAEQQQQQQQQERQQVLQAQPQRPERVSRLPSKRATSCSANSGDASGQGTAGTASADTASSHGGHARSAGPNQQPPRPQPRLGSFSERFSPIIGTGPGGVASSSSGRHDRTASGARPASKYARTAQSPQLNAGLTRRAVLGSPQRAPVDASTAASPSAHGMSWGTGPAVGDAALLLQQQQAQLLHMAAGWHANTVPGVHAMVAAQSVAAGTGNAAMPGLVPDLVLDTADLFAGHNLHGSTDAAAPYMLFGSQFNAAGPVHVNNTATHTPSLGADDQPHQQPLLQQQSQQQPPQQQQQQQVDHPFPHILSSEAFGAHLQQYSGVFNQGLPFGTQQWVSQSPSLSNSQSHSKGPSHSQHTPSHNAHSLARAGSNAAPGCSDSDDDNISPAVMAAAADAANLEPAPLPSLRHPLQGSGFRAQRSGGWHPAPGADRPAAVAATSAAAAPAVPAGAAVGPPTSATAAAPTATPAAPAVIAEHAAFNYFAAQPNSRPQPVFAAGPSTQRTRPATEAGIKRKLPADSAPQPGPVAGSASRGGLRGKAHAPSFKTGNIGLGPYRVVSDESDGDSVHDDGHAGNEHSAAGLQGASRRSGGRGGGGCGRDDDAGSGDEGNDSCGASGTTEKRLHMTELAELLAGSAAIRQLGGAQSPGELCSEEQALQLLSKLQLPETPAGGGSSSRSATQRSRKRGSVPPALQHEYERQKGVVRDLVARLNDALVGLKSIKEMAGSGDEDGEGAEGVELGTGRIGGHAAEGGAAADV